MSKRYSLDVDKLQALSVKKGTFATLENAQQTPLCGLSLVENGQQIEAGICSGSSVYSSPLIQLKTSSRHPAVRRYKVLGIHWCDDLLLLYAHLSL
jgi:hypothetical protein